MSGTSTLRVLILLKRNNVMISGNAINGIRYKNGGPKYMVKIERTPIIEAIKIISLLGDTDSTNHATNEEESTITTI